jgi:hypothetical protein
MHVEAEVAVDWQRARRENAALAAELRSSL